MSIKIQITKEQKQKSDTAIAFIYKGNRLSASAETLDQEYDGIISHQLDNAQSFKGKAGQSTSISLPKAAGYLRIILIGLGDAAKIDINAAEKAGTKIYDLLKSCGSENATIFVEKDSAREKLSTSEMTAYIAFGADLKSYTFDKYKTDLLNKDKDAENKDDKDKIINLEIISDASDESATLFETLSAVKDGVNFARDLINEPANALYPESFANIVKDELKPLGVDIEIFDYKKLQKLGFEAHIAVGRGSVNKPYAVVMHYNGTDNKDDKPVAFVGKGVTFDTGGISIKPSAGLEAMKIDMGGAAAVSGLIKALAARKAKVNVVGIIGLAENMPSSNAYLPGDIIGSLSGKTIEVLNTDAEGRLVMCDCMTYIQQTYDPKLMIDLATLTGAIMVALGHEYAGAFVNNDELWSQLENSSKRTSEKLWRMPLDKEFSNEMKSPIADLKNLGNGRFAGASTAAGFLEFFVDKDRPWAHLDIAGMTMNTKDKKYRVSFGVRVLEDFIRSYHED